jgi:hypothetical protein
MNEHLFEVWIVVELNQSNLLVGGPGKAFSMCMTFTFSCTLSSVTRLSCVLTAVIKASSRKLLVTLSFRTISY